MARSFDLQPSSHQTSESQPERVPARRLAASAPRLLLFGGTHAVDDLYQGAVPALLPFLAADRHYTYAGLTGITLAATCLSSGIQPAFGVLTDRQRRGWLIAAGLLVAGLGVGLAGLGNSYLLTWLAIALSGVGVAAYHPEATRTARGLAGNSTQAMSWFSVGGNVGIALGPLVVSPVLLATGLRGTPLLAIPAVVTALLLAISRPWLRAGAGQRTRPPGRAATAGQAAAGQATAGQATARQATTGQATAGQATAGRDDWRSFGRLTVIVICRSIAYFGVVSLLALFVIRRFHQPTAVGSAALFAFAAAGVAGSLTGGWLADRWGRLPTIRLGYLCGVPALVLLAVAPEAGVAFAGAVLSGFMLFMPFAVQVTLGQDYLPNRIGTASGVTLGLALSIGGLAAPLFGVLADSHGLPVTLAVLAVFPAASVALASRLREPQLRS
jgi:MFS transporter, FSR family, fosmidomycin resistance protein